MLSPDELKGYVDIAVSLLGAGGFGAIVLAVIGLRRGAVERAVPVPAPDGRATIGGGGMMGLAGMLASEHFGMELNQHLRGLVDGIKHLAQVHEDAIRALRQTADERSRDTRRLAEELDGLADRLKDNRPS